MPRMIAPQPGLQEFNILLQKPFSGPAKFKIEITGQPNGNANVTQAHNGGGDNMIEKVGEVQKDDVQELMELANSLRGFPSDASKDIFGLDVHLEFNTPEFQWANDDDASPEQNLGDETKDQFKRVSDSIEALARQFAKRDSAI